MVRVNLNSLPAETQRRIRDALWKHGRAEHRAKMKKRSREPQKRRVKADVRGSDLEEKFAALVRTLANSLHETMEREYRFAPPRLWRFDFAWPQAMVAVEMEGGAYTARGHRTITNFQSDCEKYNAAAAMGWCVLRYTVVDLRERPVQCIEQVQAAIAKRRAS